MKGIDILHKTATISLFGITLAGAYFTANGSYSIISRRLASPVSSTQSTTITSSSTELKK